MTLKNKDMTDIKYCRCGVQIPERRVDFLLKNKLPLSCINHSSTQKVGGFMTSTGKTDRELIIASQETVEQLHKASARAGTGVSKGVKMNQSYVPKYTK